MTAATWIFGAFALGLLLVSVWLLRERFRLTAERDVARSERDARAEQLRQRDADQTRLKETFNALAADALRSSNEQFLNLAKESFKAEREHAKGELEQRKGAIENLVKPIRERLEKTDATLQRIEKERAESFGALAEQARKMAETNRALHDQTGKLVQALRKPQVRGRYGEIQLERVVEVAGMRSYCDFDTQSTMQGAAGQTLRPDMVVRLPNGRVIAVDAKTNIEPYLDAIDAETPEQAETHLDRFARNVAEQAESLAKKEYWRHDDASPEFVVMFIPGDQFIDAALQRRPDLLDLAAEKGVIIASPSTLIGLLRAVHVGWREKSLSDSAQELFTLGRELHERAVVALEHASKVGRAITAAADRYNDFVGSVDARLVPTLRKFEESGARSSKELKDLRPLEASTRQLQSLPEAEAPSDQNEPPRMVTRSNEADGAPAERATGNGPRATD